MNPEEPKYGVRLTPEEQTAMGLDKPEMTPEAVNAVVEAAIRKEFGSGAHVNFENVSPQRTNRMAGDGPEWSDLPTGSKIIAASFVALIVVGALSAAWGVVWLVLKTIGVM